MLSETLSLRQPTLPTLLLDITDIIGATSEVGLFSTSAARRRTLAFTIATPIATSTDMGLEHGYTTPCGADLASVLRCGFGSKRHSDTERLGRL